jgi:hypothetical protein
MIRKTWTDLSLEHQEYVAASVIDDHKVVEAGGPQIEFKVKTKNTGNARNTGLFAVDVTGVDDVMIDGKVGWTKQTTNFSYDVDEELFQTDRETIINILKIREHDALSDMAELDEENLWEAPSSTTDIRPMGIPFWIQKDATTTVGGGFNGGNPSGFTAGAAGISSTTYPRWTNWTFGYDQVTVDDLILKVKKSLAFTNFKAPVPHPETGFGKAAYQIFTTYRVVEPCERLAETRNDNLGKDLAKYLNQVTIGGVPMKWVPYLEANDTSDPLYGVNWEVLRPYVKKGANMRRSGPLQSPKQHTVREVHYDNWMNWVCVNRRRLWVGSKS